MGELATANLASRGASIAYVANRSGGPARELAERFGAAAIGLEAIPGALGDVDVVLAASGSPAALICPGDVPSRHKRPLFFIDIAVPRDVDPGVGDLDGCYLYDIDDLDAVVAETLAGRRVEAKHAERLVALEAERFREWRASLDVVPAIASLRARAEEIRVTELAKLGELPDDER